jgi:hypothetical protein
VLLVSHRGVAGLTYGCCWSHIGVLLVSHMGVADLT